MGGDAPAREDRARGHDEARRCKGDDRRRRRARSRRAIGLRPRQTSVRGAARFDGQVLRRRQSRARRVVDGRVGGVKRRDARGDGIEFPFAIGRWRTHLRETRRRKAEPGKRSSKQRAIHLVGVGPALFLLERKRAVNHCLQLDADVRRYLAKGGRRPRRGQNGDLGRGRRLVDEATREQREHRGPERPDVGSPVDFARAPERLLRRHERGSSDGSPRSRRGLRLVCLEEATDSEVENLHLSVRRHEDVLRLDVPVHDPLRVRCGQGSEDRMRERNDLLDRQSPLVPLGAGA